MTSITPLPGRFVYLLALGLLSNPLFPWPTSEAQADSFNAKPGAWEMTFTTQSSGMLIPPDVLAAMPPEQRAKVEQSMQRRSGKPKTHTVKTCLTKEDLDQHRIIKEDDDEPGCKTTVVTKSSAKLVFERACPPPHASTSQVTVEAQTTESLIGSMDTDRPRAGKVHLDFKSRWIGASCTGIAD
ncbi:MAG TPA: DUF3617 domain-containing protein [Nitrospira sp.]|nr:DUF3617 domain-containing protein [Nitrospira sp. NTP1]HQR13218.1 DUF3617 domain-containing protein [Nitrospira sp.]